MEATVQREWASGLWRSEDMSLLSFHVQREVASATIRELGSLGLCQFRDLSPELSGFQREYIHSVRRCEELERKLRYFQEQLAWVRRTDQEMHNIVISEDHTGDESIEQGETLDSIEQRMEELEVRLRDANNRYEGFLKQRNSSLEYLAVLQCESDFVRGSEGEMLGAADLRDHEAGGSSLNYVVGVMPSAKLYPFERSVYRATRGNFYLKSMQMPDPLPDPVTRQKVQKTVFVAFFAATRVRDIVIKLAEANGSTIYPDASASDNATGLRADLSSELDALALAQQGTESELSSIMSQLSCHLIHWWSFVSQQKAIYDTLNLLKYQGTTAVAEAWVPARKIELVRSAVAHAGQTSSAQVEAAISEVHSNALRPTWFETDKFTASFQGIVDAYGMARYKEVNPTVFTIVTFPFLFAVMFGDAGHAFLLLLLSLAMVLNEKKLNNPVILGEMGGMIFGGRYLMLVMSVFALWMGFLYNDVFGLMIGLFGNEWQWKWDRVFNVSGTDVHAHACMEQHGVPHEHWKDCMLVSENGFMTADRPGYGNNYPFGVDPGWALASNRLDFYNSFKMKGAVILGVGQMMLGIALSALNSLRQKNWHEIAFVVVPEVLFLGCTFGWMDFLIIMKWLTNWQHYGYEERGSSFAPSLLSSMSDFFLKAGNRPQSTIAPQDGHLGGDFFVGQYGFQMFLLLIAFLSVPVLLFPIPCIKFFEMRKHSSEYTASLPDGDLEMTTVEPASDAHAEGEEEHDFSQVVIHQLIHTVEFVLGAVSNTASYLRLWALSLAHAQLSEVFWAFTMEMVLLMHVSPMVHGVLLFFAWAIWFGVTLGVLCAMEGLSAFLHALRLHWVEFQNKFFAADGVAFAPLDLPAVAAERKLKIELASAES